MSELTDDIRMVIVERGWHVETAIALILDYLQREGKSGQALDTLIADLVNRGQATGFIAFLEDCITLGADEKVARSVGRPT